MESLKLIVDCFKDREDPRIDDADQFTDTSSIKLSLITDKENVFGLMVKSLLIKSIILAVAQANINENQKNLFSVYQVLSVLGKEVTFKGEKNPKMLLSAYINSLDEINPARVAFTPIANSPIKLEVVL